MLELYEPLLRVSDVHRHLLAADLHYGQEARQVLDVFARPDVRQAPVLLFVHGGAFVRGEKNLSRFVHANVAAEFAANGFVTANMGYRLAPGAPWPEGARDVLAALSWLRAHARDFGGDPDRLYLMGHSAGCAHCATAVWDQRVGGLTALPVGLVLVSPRLRVDVSAENPNRDGVLAYYGSDTLEQQDRAPLAQLRHSSHAQRQVPVLLVSTGYENPGLQHDVADALAALTTIAGRQRSPTHIHLPDHNHMSVIAQFNTDLNKLGEEIRSWCTNVNRCSSEDLSGVNSMW